MTTPRALKSMEQHQIEPRVSALEQFVKSLDEDIKGLASAVDRGNLETRTALANLSQAIQRTSHTDWRTLASWAAVIIAILGGVGTMYVQPLKDDSQTFHGRIERLEDKTVNNATAIAAQEVQNAEIETQFKTGKELEEMRYEMGMVHLKYLVERLQKLENSQTQKGGQ